MFLKNKKIERTNFESRNTLSIFSINGTNGTLTFLADRMFENLGLYVYTACSNMIKSLKKNSFIFLIFL